MQHRLQDVLMANGFIQSMSRKGNCYDNAVAEAFPYTQDELVYDYRYETRAEAGRVSSSI